MAEQKEQKSKLLKEMEKAASEIRILINGMPPEELLGYIYSQLMIANTFTSSQSDSITNDTKIDIQFLLEYVHAVFAFDIAPSVVKFDEKDLGQTQDSAKTYTSEEELSLDNAKANMNLEFSNDQLNQVSFTFYLEKDAKEWIQKEVDELNSLYGDVETTGLDNQTYQWSGEQNTVLQMVVFSKNDEKATVILSVASFEYSIGS